MDKRSITSILIVILLGCHQSKENKLEATQHSKINDLLKIEIINNNRVGHQDILFEISGLTGAEVLDSYFLLIHKNRESAVSSLMQYWREKIINSKNGETVFLPIDFSDEYTGCLKVDKLGDNLKLTYGYSQFGRGRFVNPANPGNYSKGVKDFKDTEKKSLIVNEKLMILALDKQISKLKNTH